MPVFDRKCDLCGAVSLDRLEPSVTSDPNCLSCAGGVSRRVWLPGQKANSVIGDGCDVSVRHGLCNADGSPRRYTSKSEMAAEAKKRGLVNHVTHMGTQGGDKSRHTSRWI